MKKEEEEEKKKEKQKKNKTFFRIDCVINTLFICYDYICSKR